MLKKWRDACGFSETDDVSKLLLCSCHFLQSDFLQVSGDIKRLSSHAVPSQGMPQNYFNEENGAKPNIPKVKNVNGHGNGNDKSQPGK